MIKSLSYTVTFPTGRTLSRDIDFQKGLTAICGPNESGKTFVIEVIRWCLFGAKALRGDADDYKSLSAEMSFTVRGVDYRVERKSDKATIYCGGKALATGVRPVNMKIITILGYGLDVFDIAHVANQGDVTRLSDMAPTERKKMVDQVIGLDRVDELNKWVGEQATFLRREIEIMERLVGEQPVPPECPAGYIPFNEIGPKVAEVSVLKGELDRLEGWLSVPRNKPVMPQHPDVDRKETEGAIQQIKANQAERARILAIPTVDYDIEAVRLQWEAYDLWQSREQFVKANPRPGLKTETIASMLADHAQCMNRDRLEKQIAELEKSGTATCPSCSTEFCLAHDALEPIRKELVSLQSVSRPDISVSALHDEERRDNNWRRPETLAQWEELKAAQPTEKPVHGRQAPAGAITTAERDRLLPPLLTGLEAHGQALRQLQAYEASLAVYERDIGPYEAWVAEQAVKQARVAELKPIVAALPDLVQALEEARAFEQATKAYETAFDIWKARCDEVDAKALEAGGWKDAKAFLAELRVRIKGYLTPSLSKVASHLLTQMTGGARTSIVVDPDFEITVDGQKLATLSGSGKACANLALRIGLGQVLTNNVLSLFIGDEIDASMDEQRAENTHLSLRKMVNSVSQILLITHKVPSADHTVVFEGAMNVGRFDTGRTQADGIQHLESREVVGA